MNLVVTGNNKYSQVKTITEQIVKLVVKKPPRLIPKILEIYSTKN